MQIDAWKWNLVCCCIYWYWMLRLLSSFKYFCSFCSPILIRQAPWFTKEICKVRKILNWSYLATWHEKARIKMWQTDKFVLITWTIDLINIIWLVLLEVNLCGLIYNSLNTTSVPTRREVFSVTSLLCNSAYVIISVNKS